MPEILTHYFKKGSKPFLTLSALNEEEALAIMKRLYVDDAMWGRFRNPLKYIRERRQTENWVRENFITKGGKPVKQYPIYMVLGRCPALEENVRTGELQKIEIPLAYFLEQEVSYTFVDSMYSLVLEKEKPEEYYQPAYHGKVFTLTEIKGMIEKKGEPKEGWWGHLPEDFFPYIEAQVWHQEKLFDYARNIG